jgi:hypothetical protein
MKLNTITALFAEAYLSFVPLTSNLTDDDLTAIHEIFTPLLLGILYDANAKHYLVSLIAPLDKYESTNTIFFI